MRVDSSKGKLKFDKPLQIKDFEHNCELPKSVHWEGLKLVGEMGGGCLSPFRDTQIIADLVRAVQKYKKNSSIKKKLMSQWILKYGFLSLDLERIVHDYSESESDFWDNAIIFADYWERYSAVTNRDLIGMSNWLSFKPDEGESDFDLIKTIGVFRDEPFENDKCPQLFKSIQEIEQFPLEDKMKLYQFGCGKRIVKEIIEHIQPVTLGCWGLKKFRQYQDNDVFLTRPSIYFDSTIKALWFMFYLLVAQHPDRKICPYCYDAFEPDRSDQKYCSKRCYDNAKRARSYQKSKQTKS